MSKPQFTGDLAWASNFATDGGPFWVPALQANADSGEHAFNALKTLDPTEQAHVLAAPDPRTSKGRGRKVSLRADWDAGVRTAAMAHVLRAKFTLPHYEALLLGSGGTLLVETNHWHDQFWGDCYCPKHSAIPGTNMLGQLLMAIRAQKRGL